MFNHNRGLWGYSGTASDGEPLTIQSTGMGGPSAAIVISELADLGAATMLRVGTCGALRADLELGELIVATEAIGDDGTSRALGVSGRVPASPALLEALVAAAGAREGPVVSTDLFYDDPREPEAGWIAAGALAVEMESSTLFALAARRGFEAGSSAGGHGSADWRARADRGRGAAGRRASPRGRCATGTDDAGASRRGDSVGPLFGVCARRARRSVLGGGLGRGGPWAPRPWPGGWPARPRRLLASRPRSAPAALRWQRACRSSAVAALRSSSRCSSRSRPSSIPSSR